MKRQRRGPPLSALAQPDLPIGCGVPKDPALREALVRIACRAETDGPIGLGIDLSTASGRAGWANAERAIRWIYDNAIDVVDYGERSSNGNQAAADR